MRASLLLFVGAFLAVPSARAQIASTDLIERAREWDGKTVEYRGEAVGDVMKRGEFAWVNLHDGANALGVWCPCRFAERIKILGDFRHSGDMVLVTGIFHRACPEHGGDLDIHAISLEKAAAGGVRVHPVSREKIFAAAGLGILAAALGWWERSRRMAGKKNV